MSLLGSNVMLVPCTVSRPATGPVGPVTATVQSVPSVSPARHRSALPASTAWLKPARMGLNSVSGTRRSPMVLRRVTVKLSLLLPEVLNENSVLPAALTTL
ncbi:hypothetical protein [uncultured Salinisphaera sp.]|uniref:hypothetical protein n=1 Tax=uncultured Salinisphaera sp. TaxID=359372 RepID=UPI0032B2AB43